MNITTNQIIALQQIEGCGLKTIKAFADYASTEYQKQIISNEELWVFVNECIENKVAPRCKLSKLSLDEIDSAVYTANKILEKSNDLGIKAISYLDDSYPKCLLDTIDEEGKSSIPIILYYKGDINIAKLPGIAIIGTREPTPEGIKAGTYLGKIFAEAGFNIVSGLAVGCDTSGHKGALLCEGGKTTSFLAHGLDSVYPEENKGLADEIIAKGGLLMSEYPIGTRVNRYNLVARDRLQAALSKATIVIQTGERGGTNHAANTTLKANKPLFCVKYANESLMSNERVRGNILLVQKGAKYISSKDALEVVKSSLNEKINIRPIIEGNLF